MLGHANMQTTLRYAHLSDRDIEAAEERVGETPAGLMGKNLRRRLSLELSRPHRERTHDSDP